MKIEIEALSPIKKKEIITVNDSKDFKQFKNKASLYTKYSGGYTTKIINK